MRLAAVELPYLSFKEKNPFHIQYHAIFFFIFHFFEKDLLALNSNTREGIHVSHTFTGGLF